MTPEILILIIVLLIIGGFIFYGFYFSKKAVVRRNLKKAAGKKISQFFNGDIAKVVGQVEFVGEPLSAPLSGRPCAYYHVLVEQHVSNGKNSHWKKLVEEEISGTFVIRDGKHTAFVDQAQIKTYLVQDKTYNSGFLNDASIALDQYLSRHGHKSTGLLGLNKTIRYKEGVLENGELMAVVGKGEWKEARELHLPESYGRILHISATDEHPVYLSDDPETVRVTYSDDGYYLK
ncbi:MAG: hypothetical protein HYZ14_08250 [Bacteroidetes bacterium]|nr:hypothetical protein [Bacteroidota bacterium]